MPSLPTSRSPTGGPAFDGCPVFVPSDGPPASENADDAPTLFPSFEFHTAGEPPAVSPASVESVTERLVNGYRLRGRIGRGAFGQVFHAEAPGGVPVAVKELPCGAGNDGWRSEQQALAVIKRLSHPFLIHTHAYWISGGHLFIVMDLAEESLDDRLRACVRAGAAGLPAADAVRYFGEYAEALDYLHSQRVSHRDVKPKNLLLLKGHAKVGDFGLARAHAHQETLLACACGTPLYMAPEVWRRRFGYASDQYSLAASYAHCRLGRPPFVAEFLDQLIAKHRQEIPNLAPMPEAEQRVLRRALAKAPGDRYPSCRAFTDALREAV